MRRIVLASTSRYRAELLARLGTPFEVASPEFVERNDPGQPPEELVARQALGKADSLRASFPDALILGSDQVAAVDGRILTKPGTADRAAAQLRELRGREHRLLTAVALLDAASDRVWQHLDVTYLSMRPLTDAEIDAYVQRDQPLDCAGSYKAESLGVALFESIRGEDATAVVGLPLMAVQRLLDDAGVNVLLQSE